MSNGFIGIVCGLKSEARLFAPWKDDARVRVGVSGANAAHAGEIASTFANAGARALLSIGVSGGLVEDARPGALLLARGVATADGSVVPADAALLGACEAALARAQIAARTCTLYGSDEIVASAAAKAELARAFDAVAVDMESHGVAAAAREAGVPFGALRAVADPYDRAIPQSALEGVAPDGSTRVLNVLTAALRRPSDFPGLIRVGKDSSAALARLRVALFELLPALLG